jgi:outer membrane receptor protein involved in Fe transport
MKKTRRGLTGLGISLLILVLVSSQPASAQYNAQLQGTVTDTSGAAIPGAKITLKDQATGVERDTTTDAAGVYHFVQIPPGTYTVAAESKGFKTNVTQNVSVEAELPRGLDIQLALGEVAESVTVNGSVIPALRTEDASISGTLTTQDVERLPQIARDPYELVNLAPGVFGDNARNGSGLSVGFPNGPGINNGSGGPGGSNTAIFQTENQISISANGQRITSNDYMVDGVSVNSLQWGGAAVVTPSPDSVQEITVLSNDYDASDGRNAGAHIKVITKSGTDKFHGSGFFQYEEPGLNAYNKFGGYNPGVGFAPDIRDDDAFRQFGGSLGGPILKDKLFFFFNYEGLRDNNDMFEDQYVETSQFDSLLANFAPNTPVAATVAEPGVAPRVAAVLPASCAPFAPSPCQVIGDAVNVGSPLGPYGSYVAAAQGAGLTSIPEFEYAETIQPQHTRGDQYNARIDYTRGRNTFAGSTFLTYYDNIEADPSAQDRPDADFATHRSNPSAFLSWITSLAPTVVNEARMNFTRFAYNDVAANPQIDWAIPRTEIQTFLPFAERIRYGAAQGDTSPGIFAQNTFAFHDQISVQYNTQALKFGVEVDRAEDNSNLLGGSRPDIVFNSPWDFANGAAIFEQIEVNPLTGAAPITARYYREGDYAVYLQDDWKLRPNLTLNLGVRWDYYGPPSEARGQLENIVPGSGPTGLENARAVLGGLQYHPTERNVGPRVGFAWSPDRFETKAVLRGGFGIAYDRFDDVSFDNTRDNPPIVASYGLCCGGTGATVDSKIIYALGTSSRNPTSYPSDPALATPLNPATDLPEITPTGAYSAPNVYANPLNSPVPYVYLYSLQVEYALPKGWVATVGYQGSSSHDLLRIQNLQYFYPMPSSLIGAVFNYTPDTTANFNALVTQVEHRFSRGFQATFSYTYSKSLDEVSAEGPGFVTNQTYPTDDSTEYGPSDYDATHYVRAWGIWDLPIFRQRHDWAGRIAGGWQLNPIFEFHSGFPWTPVASNDCNLVLGSATICPIRPIGYSGSAGSSADTSAFLPPTASNFPNGATSYFNVNGFGFPGVGRNSFRGPRFSSLDFSAAKTFGLPTLPFFGEGARIELRANFYNVFNKLNLAPFTFGSTSTTVSYSNTNGVPQPNPQFGTASTGLAGRVVELQARLSF